MNPESIQNYFEFSKTQNDILIKNFEKYFDNYGLLDNKIIDLIEKTINDEEQEKSNLEMTLRNSHDKDEQTLVKIQIYLIDDYVEDLLNILNKHSQNRLRHIKKTNPLHRGMRFNSKRKYKRKSARKSARKSRRKSKRKSVRKSARNSRRKSRRKSKRKYVRKSKRKSKRKSRRKTRKSRI